GAARRAAAGRAAALVDVAGPGGGAVGVPGPGHELRGGEVAAADLLMAGGCRVVLEVDVPASAGLHDPVGVVEPAGAVDPVEGGEVVVGRSGHAVVLLGDRGEGQGPAGGEGVGRKGC